MGSPGGELHGTIPPVRIGRIRHLKNSCRIMKPRNNTGYTARRQKDSQIRNTGRRINPDTDRGTKDTNKIRHNRRRKRNRGKRRRNRYLVIRNSSKANKTNRKNDKER